MKVLIVNTYYFPNMIGGAEHSVKLLAENLKKCGYDIAIYCVDSIEPLEKKIINGIKVYRGRAGRFDIDVRKGNKKSKILTITNKVVEMRNYAIKKDINYIFEDFKPDIIHTNNIYGVSPLIWKIAAKNGVKVIHTLRDYWLISPDIDLPSKKDNIILKVYQKYFRDTNKYVDVVTAPSKFTLNKFINQGYFKNSISKNIVNAIEIDYKGLIEILEQRKEKIDKVVTFIFVGALTERKGIIDLLKVFTEYQNENVRLIICGDGRLRDRVNEYGSIDSRITIKGKLTSVKLREEYLLADVLIIPSVWEEPFGRVVIEANQYGLHVIGSRMGGIAEILSTIQTGELYCSDNLKELKSLIDYFSHRENIKKYFDNIKDNIMEYSVTNHTNQFETVYKELIHNNE